MMVYRPRNRYVANRVYRKKLLDYFLPLFLFIAFAVIVILSFQLYHAIFNDGDVPDAFLQKIQGRSQIQPAGSFNADETINDMRIFRGDEIHTEPGGRVVLRFFQRASLRLDSSSSLVFGNAVRESGSDVLQFEMKGGRVWVDTGDPDGSSLELDVSTPRLRISSRSGVFDIQDSSSHDSVSAVRILHGDIRLSVIVPDGDGVREVETFTLTEGQEFLMDPAAYRAFQKFQSPEVIAPIAEQFVSEEWYLWNSVKNDNLL